MNNLSLLEPWQNINEISVWRMSLLLSIFITITYPIRNIIKAMTRLFELVFLENISFDLDSIDESNYLSLFPAQYWNSSSAVEMYSTKSNSFRKSREKISAKGKAFLNHERSVE